MEPVMRRVLVGVVGEPQEAEIEVKPQYQADLPKLVHNIQKALYTKEQVAAFKGEGKKIFVIFNGNALISVNPAIYNPGSKVYVVWSDHFPTNAEISELEM